MTDLLKDIPVSVAMEERLAHEEKLHEETKAKNVELQLQVDELTKELAHLKADLAAVRTMDEYQEREGVLWKRMAGGQFHDGPRCPKCKIMMTRIVGKKICTACNITI